MLVCWAAKQNFDIKRWLATAVAGTFTISVVIIVLVVMNAVLPDGLRGLVQ